MRGRAGWATDIGLLAVGTAVFFYQALLMRGTFFVQDVMVQNYPFRDFFTRALQSGALPLWDAAINCGFPLFAEGQAGVFYPFNFFSYWLLPTYASLNLNIIAHIWWAGVGAYAFLRVLGCVRLAALTGGVSYAFSGYLIIRAMSPNYIDAAAWMPFIFLCFELATRRRRWGYLSLAGGIAGLQYLAGHPQAAVYAQGGAMLYGVFAAWQRALGWKWIIAPVWVPLAGVLLAAVQLLPTAELVGLSGRSGGVGIDQFLNMSLPPERLISLLLPNFFGNSSVGTYWGRQDGFFIQLCFYAGVLPLILAWAAAWYRRDPYTVFFVALSAVALLLSLGRFTPLFDKLYAVPGLSFFRIPSRFLLWSSLGLALLSGLGLDTLMRRARESGGTYGIIWICGVVAAVAVGFFWLKVGGIGGGAEAMDPVSILYRQQLYADLGRCLGGLLLGGGVIMALGKGRRCYWGWAVPLLIFADLFHFGGGFNAVVPPTAYTSVPAEAKAILNAPRDDASASPPRLLSLVNEKNAPYDWHGGWALDPSDYLAYTATLRMYSAGLYGLYNALPGWSPLHLSWHWEFMRGYPAVAPLAGIEYIVNHGPLRGASSREVFRDQARVYRFEGALPRAYLAAQAVSEPADLSQRLEHLTRSEVLNGSAVVLADGQDESTHSVKVDGFKDGSSGAMAAQIVEYGPEEVQVRLEDGHQGGYLVLSDTFYPGWEAQVDGKAVEVLRANHVFRAVAVGAGAEQVVFSYRSTFFLLGMWISLCAWAVVLVSVWQGMKGEVLVMPWVHGGMPLKEWVGMGGAIVLLHAVVARWPLWVGVWERAALPSGLWGG
jgi:hypothetical protein